MADETDQKAHEAHPDHHLSPRQVADAIGVSVSSLKRWCDRGDLPTTKTAGGHRRIARSAVVRYLREHGFDPKRPDLLGLPAGTQLDARDTDEVLPQIIAALTRGDEQRMVALLTGLFLAKRSVADIADRFVAPAFATIGHKWEQGTLQVYKEHRAVVAARAAIHALRGYLPAAPEGAPVAVSATLSGDSYLLPITLIELTLREVGWNTTVLGPNHPADTLLAALADLQPRLACLSISYIPDRAALIADTRTIYEQASELGVALAIGGSRLTDELRRELPCTAHCGSMTELVSLARGLEPLLTRGASVPAS